jgi:hypothetical protein
MRTETLALLEAARVPAKLPSQRFGRWQILRQQAPAEGGPRIAWFGTHVWPEITALRRFSDANVHVGGDVVMEDGAVELRRHLPIWLNARGRVLVTGLGLGCVVRGLLASPRVEHVDVIEIDEGIMRTVGVEFAADPRVTLHLDDALTWEPPRGARWDVAWHDIHSDNGFGALQVLHAALLIRFGDRVARQGAWGFPREFKRWVPGLLG